MYYREIYNSYEELKEAIDKYIRYYNTQRIKTSLGYRNPVEYREQMSASRCGKSLAFGGHLTWRMEFLARKFNFSCNKRQRQHGHRQDNISIKNEKRGVKHIYQGRV